jgi:hypothetical protein
MLHQLFRKQVPIEILMDLLDKICLKTDKYYLVDANAFKVLLYNKYHEDFCKTMLEYYHSSKAHYITREFSYKTFINVVRQICKSNDVMYGSKMKYEKSKYNIDYFVYFTQN